MFVDSSAFLAESLEQLVQNLYDPTYINFIDMRKLFGDHMDLLSRNGFYPYEWVDGTEKLDYDGIPEPEALNSQTTSKTIYMMIRLKVNLITQ